MNAEALLNRPDLAPAARHLAAACRASRLWSEKLEAALNYHGDNGSHISGCGRDHFPEAVKNELRSLARAVTVQSDAGYASRAAARAS